MNLDPEHSGVMEELAFVLKGVGLDRIVTSSERRAVQTGTALARLVGLTTHTDHRLAEVRRPFVSDDRVFAENVKSYLNGGTVIGWEGQETAVSRMREAVEDALATGFVGLVTHGTAMSLSLADLGLVQAWNFWEELRAPDGWLIDGSRPRRLVVAHED